MGMLVVIGTSPFMDMSVVVGPFRSEVTAGLARQELTYRGWVAETVTLQQVSEVPMVTNAEE